MFEKRRGLLRRYVDCRTLPRALLSCADKKVGKEAAEDLPYGPRTPQTAKGEANQAVQSMTPALLPLWKPLGDSAEAVQTVEKLQNTRSSRISETLVRN